MEKGLGFLKNLFVEEMDTPTSTAQKATTPPANSITPQAISTTQVSGGSLKTKGFLKEALEEEGAKEFGYIKFKQSLDALKTIISDEKTRYVTAFITAKTLGFTKDKLTSTAETAIKTLNKELKRFEEATEVQNQETVVAGEQKVSSLDKSIQEKTEELKKLTEDITNLQKQKSDAENQVKNDRNKIDSLKNDFSSSYAEMVNEVKNDISKISNYLEG